MSTTVERELEVRGPQPPEPPAVRAWIGWALLAALLVIAGLGIWFELRTPSFTAEDLATAEDQIAVTLPAVPAYTAQDLGAAEDRIVVTTPSVQPGRIGVADLVMWEDQIVVTSPGQVGITWQEFAAAEDAA